MASNIVEILIGAKDDAKLDLDSLRAKLDELAHKVAEARVGVEGDKEAELSLDRLGVKLTMLGRKTEHARISLDGAFKVATELDALDLALDHVHKKAEDLSSDGGGGLLSKLSSGFSSVGSSLGGMLSGLPIVGDGLSSIGESGPVGAAALVALAVAAAALAVAMGPLVAALGLITVGIGAFAAAAVPEIEKVWTAVGKGGKALKSLSPDERAMAGPIESLKDQFHKLSKAIQPEVLKAFGSALRIVKDVMPALAPLAQAAGQALDGLLKNIDKWLRSSSGKQFIKWMETEGPRALATFGRALWSIMQVVGKFLADWDKAGETLLHSTGWRDAWKIIGTIVKVALDDIRMQAKIALDVIVGLFRIAGDILTGHWGRLWSDIRNTATQVWNAIRQDASAVWHAIFGDTVTTWSAIGNAIIAPIEAAYHVVTGIFGAIRSAMSGLSGGFGGVLGHIGLAAGGIAGAATGGVRSNLTMVGEHGPELVQLSAGSRVYNNAQTQGMLGGMGGGGQMQLELRIVGSDSKFMTALMNQVRIMGGDPSMFSRKVAFR